MRWRVGESPFLGTGEIRCDGVAVPKVTAFDDAEGWVEALCLDGHTGSAGKVHADPNDDGQACRVRLSGAVEWVPAS